MEEIYQSVKLATFSTDPKHINWVNEWRESHNQRNACYGAAHAAAKEMSELRVVRGWAWIVSRSANRLTGTAIRDEHWWCEAPDGTIVDPTGEQWDGWKVVGYEEYNESLHGDLPIGKCMDCGDFIYKNQEYKSSYFCSQSCECSYRSYMGI